MSNFANHFLDKVSDNKRRRIYQMRSVRDIKKTKKDRLNNIKTELLYKIIMDHLGLSNGEIWI